MKAVYLYPVVAVQFVIALAMWYISLTNPVGYQSEWAILLAVELFLLAIVILSAIRYFVGDKLGR